MFTRNQIIYSFLKNIIDDIKKTDSEEFNSLIEKIKTFLSEHKEDFNDTLILIEINNDENNQDKDKDKHSELINLFTAELEFYNAFNRNMLFTQKLRTLKIILDSFKNFSLPPWLKILVDIIQEIIQIKQILNQIKKKTVKHQDT